MEHTDTSPRTGHPFPECADARKQSWPGAARRLDGVRPGVPVSPRCPPGTEPGVTDECGRVSNPRGTPRTTRNVLVWLPLGFFSHYKTLHRENSLNNGEYGKENKNRTVAFYFNSVLDLHSYLEIKGRGVCWVCTCSCIFHLISSACLREKYSLKIIIKYN